MDENGAQADIALARAAVLDRTAFGALYDRYVGRIYRYCARRSRSPEDAQDLTAAIFLRALERLDGFRGGSFAAWLFAIARTQCADHQRSRPAVAIDHAEFIVDGRGSLDDVAEAADRYRWLRHHLGQLSPDQVDVIELRLAGLTVAEIAELLHKSIPAVKMLQSRAVATLRSAAEQEGFADARFD